MTPPKFTPWTPEEDKLLVEAVAACGCQSISAWLIGPAYDDNPRRRWCQDLLETCCQIYVWCVRLPSLLPPNRPTARRPGQQGMQKALDPFA